MRSKHRRYQQAMGRPRLCRMRQGTKGRRWKEMGRSSLEAGRNGKGGGPRSPLAQSDQYTPAWQSSRQPANISIRLSMNAASPVHPPWPRTFEFEGDGPPRSCRQPDARRTVHDRGNLNSTGSKSSLSIAPRVSQQLLPATLNRSPPKAGHATTYAYVSV